MNRIIIALLVMGIAALGCSGTGSAPTFSEPITAASETTRHHALWGYWSGIINPDAETIEFTQLRTTEFHLNALPFLEPPPLLNLTLESLEFNGDIIEADIGLRHPFLGLTEFTGFDVCGIFISNGSINGFTDSDIVMPGEGDTRLLNPDGYSRWWNPSEFPVNNGTIFGYTDGLLGAPDSFADFNCTLNGYKYFCDDLDSTPDTVDDVVLENRGLFSAGQKNVRHYTIQIGDDGLIFNYAIDANWLFPSGDPPWSAPGDFAPEANRAEAWSITVNETENTLYNNGVTSGGDLSLEIGVYDWYKAGLNTVRVESPGNFTMIESASPAGGGEGYSTYQIDIIDATPSPDQIELLISVISEVEDYEGFIEGVNVTSYFMHSIGVSEEIQANYHWEFDDVATFSSTWSSGAYSELDDISPAIIEETDFEIALSWEIRDTNDIHDCESVWMVGLSTDNGVTYGNHYPPDTAFGGTLYRSDSTKITPGRQNDAYATSCFSDITGAYKGMSYIVQVEHSTSRASFVSTPNNPTRDIEVVVDSAGYIYGFTDRNGIIRYKHSINTDTVSPTDWMNFPQYIAVTGGYCSHVRSSGKDSSDTVWLAYYSISENAVMLVCPNDTPPHLSWDTPVTVYSAGSGISQVKNPSFWIDGDDTFHICYTRYNSSTGNNELVYTVDDSSFGSPLEQVIVALPTVINDAHISIGEKFGHEVAIFIYESDDSVYVATLVDGSSIGEPEEIDNNTDDIDPDAILDADQCDFHSVWATLDGNNYDIARRNGVLVED